MIRRRVYVLIYLVCACNRWLQAQHARGRNLYAASQTGRGLATAENGKTKMVNDVWYYVYHIALGILGIRTFCFQESKRFSYSRDHMGHFVSR